MPHPDKGEMMQDFISRFMADPEMRKRYPHNDQRAAVAYSYWRKRNKKKK